LAHFARLQNSHRNHIGLTAAAEKPPEKPRANL
jgi:hypothetical protein